MASPSQKEWAKHIKRKEPPLPQGLTQMQLFKETTMQQETKEGFDLEGYAERLIDGVAPTEIDPMPGEFRLAHMVIDALESLLLTQQAFQHMDSARMGYVRSLLSGNFMYFVADARRFLGEDVFTRIVEEVESNAA